MANKREWLIERRKSKGMTQEYAAQASGVSRQYYSFIESGDRGDPLPVTTARKIAAALNFDWQMFYSPITDICDPDTNHIIP